MNLYGVSLMLQSICGLVFVLALILNKIIKGKNIWQIAVIAFLAIFALAFVRAAG